jgi:RNA polymerase subunit RPABC4/transcription elongation factor Spt4
MADLIGTFRKRAEDLLDTINSAGGLRTTVEGLRRQMAESDRRRAMSRARSELRRLDAQINEMVTAVGVQAVGLHKAGRLTAPELAPLCEHVAELEAAVEQQRAELTRLEATQKSAAPAEERACSQCGRPLPPGATFCPYCGAPAPPDAPAPIRYCQNCGGELRDNSRFCPHCGQPVAGS